jgi:hypothetical protein
MKYLNPIQQYVIDYIIADNEESEAFNPLTPYMRALNGDSTSNAPFTLYNSKYAGFVLAAEDSAQDPPERFRTRCEGIKKRLLEIADFMEYLVQDGSVRTISNKQEKPMDMPEQRRLYTDFTIAEQTKLAFAGSVRIIPRLALYEYWETMVPKNRAPEYLQKIAVCSI